MIRTFDRLQPALAPAEPSLHDLREYWNPVARDHLYTTVAESHRQQLGYDFQASHGQLWSYRRGNATPVCGYYDATANRHFLSAGCVVPERHRGDGVSMIEVLGFADADEQAATALHRYLNAAFNDEYYTTERDDIGLAAFGYQYQDIAGYVLAGE